jgi:hypothetical protein
MMVAEERGDAVMLSRMDPEISPYNPCADSGLWTEKVNMIAINSSLVSVRTSIAV